jgi:hypothetical protein
MSVDHALSTTELLLEAIYLEGAQDRSAHAFLYSSSGERVLFGGLGIEIYYADREMVDAVLYLRAHGAPQLRSLSVGDVRSQLTEFVSNNFHIVSAEAWGTRSSIPLGRLTPREDVLRFADRMRSSSLFVEPRALTLFPLSVITAAKSFRSSTFFIVAPEDITPDLLGSKIKPAELEPSLFPPFRKATWARKPAASLLGVWAPNIETARRRRAAILGAIALLPHRFERYLFTGRSVVEGCCTLGSGTFTMNSSGPHTPALSEDVVIDESDHEWLGQLASKLESEHTDHRKQMRSLEYQYRAWIPDPTRRFPILFAALDAIYGDAAAATQAIVSAVQPVMGAAYDEARLRLLLGARASVVHGGAPNVYESKKYPQYYMAYYEDITRDLELIVARCLQAVVFGGSLQERPHSAADLIARQTGRIV